jgi:peroxiredoxin Q/BCP
VAGETRRDDGLLAEGALAPALAKDDHRGQAVDLRALGSKPALIYFYPKDATPGCTKEACAFRDVWARFEADGILVVGVSADDNDSHAAFAKEHALPFGLIADEDGAWAKAFGVRVSAMGMPARVSFLIGRDGRVAKVYPGVDPGVHASDVLADVASLPK